MDMRTVDVSSPVKTARKSRSAKASPSKPPAAPKQQKSAAVTIREHALNYRALGNKMRQLQPERRETFKTRVMEEIWGELSKIEKTLPKRAVTLDDLLARAEMAMFWQWEHSVSFNAIGYQSPYEPDVLDDLTSKCTSTRVYAQLVKACLEYVAAQKEGK